MSANKRRSYRVDDAIPMRDTPLSTESFREKKTRIGVRSRQSGMMAHVLGGDLSSGVGFDHLGSDIGKALQMMDQKLNYLISIQMLSDASQLNLSERAVNLSVSGMRFFTESHYKEGDCLEVTMMLPSFPPQLMELLCEVTRVKSTKGGQQVAVDFVFRNEEEERSISGHVFKRQREMIRLTAQRERKR